MESDNTIGDAKWFADWHAANPGFAQRKIPARRRRAANLVWALEYVNGGPEPRCKHCGISNEAAIERDSAGRSGRLEFDHVDPASKEFNISGHFHYSREILQPELDKCQLLCVQCHRAKTATEAI